MEGKLIGSIKAEVVAKRFFTDSIGPDLLMISEKNIDVRGNFLKTTSIRRTRRNRRCGY